MNRKQFLKRLGLLSTTAIAAPAILAETLQSQPATTKPTESVERMRFHNDGRVTSRDKYGNIIHMTKFRNDT
jgi:hypothetical protein